jgi:D-alanyl-D-alanine carboxypeptidase
MRSKRRLLQQPTLGQGSRKTGWHIGLAASLLASVVYGASPTDVQDKLAVAYARIDGALADTSMPGLVVGVTDRTAMRKVFVHGFSDLKSRTPLTPDSLFAIGSISKSFTAIALMQLADQGRFDPQAPIKKYLPWFEVNSGYPVITGHHLLSHTAGLPNYLADLSSSRYAAYELRNFTPAYAPGAHYWYSNTGFQILGYVLEGIDKQPYHTQIEQRIFKPLGMTHSFAIIDNSLRTKLTTSYERWPYEERNLEAPWFEYTAADGSIASTASDMCAYLRFFLNQGAFPHGELLGKESFKRLTTPVLENYAYGLQVLATDGDAVIRHGGSIFGYNSFVEAHVIDGFGIVFLSNGTLDPVLDKWISDTIRASFRGLPMPEMPRARAIAERTQADAYAKTYRAPDGTELRFVVQQQQLALASGNSFKQLLPIGTDTFRIAPPDSDLMPYVFGRDADRADGDVTEVSHGAQWFVDSNHSGLATVIAPAEYSRYVGHYVNHSPEGPSARIFIRGNHLMIQLGGGNHALASTAPGDFRLTEPAYNPEQFSFDTVLGEQAIRLIISGTPLYRIDTP